MPQVYGPGKREIDLESDQSIYTDDSLKQELISNLRKKCKAELKKTKDKAQRMKLDNDLRLSYKQNIHSQLHFGSRMSAAE